MRLFQTKTFLPYDKTPRHIVVDLDSIQVVDYIYSRIEIRLKGSHTAITISDPDKDIFRELISAWANNGGHDE